MKKSIFLTDARPYLTRGGVQWLFFDETHSGEWGRRGKQNSHDLLPLTGSTTSPQALGSLHHSKARPVTGSVLAGSSAVRQVGTLHLTATLSHRTFSRYHQYADLIEASLYITIRLKGKKVKGLPSHSYGTSLAIWDHTVLPVRAITRQLPQVNSPRLNPSQ